MAILLRVCSFVFFIWFVMLPTHGTSQALASGLAFKEPTHLLLSGMGESGTGLKFAPIGSWDQFQEIPGLDNSSVINPRSVAFDPVEQRAYWGDNEIGAVFRCKLDGSQVERIVGNPDYAQNLNGIAIDPVNRRLYFSANDTTIQSSNLDGTGLEILVNNGSETSAVAIDATRSRVYWSDTGDYTIGRVNTDGSGYMTVVDSRYYPYALTVDEKGERLYWTEYEDKKIESSDLDGNNQTVHVVAECCDGTSEQYGLAVYQDQYIVSDVRSSNVAVFNDTYGVETTLQAGEQEPFVFDSVLSLCLFHKYESPPPMLGIKLIQTVTKRGLLIARIIVPIEVEMAGWTLEVNFPRQVFDLKIFGCDVEIQDRSQTNLGGLRRGTKYTLIPSPGSDIPLPGSKLSFKVEAKTWQKQRGFKRGILADFYPTPLA